MTTYWFPLIALVMVGLLGMPATGAELAEKKVLTLDIVKEMAETAERYADGQGWKVYIDFTTQSSHPATLGLPTYWNSSEMYWGESEPFIDVANRTAVLNSY